MVVELSPLTRVLSVGEKQSFIFLSVVRTFNQRGQSVWCTVSLLHTFNTAQLITAEKCLKQTLHLSLSMLYKR